MFVSHCVTEFMSSLCAVEFLSDTRDKRQIQVESRQKDLIDSDDHSGSVNKKDSECYGLSKTIQYQSYLTGPKQIVLIFDWDELFQ